MEGPTITSPQEALPQIRFKSLTKTKGHTVDGPLLKAHKRDF